MKTKLLALWVVALLLAGCATWGTRSRTGDILAATDARQLALACCVWANDHHGVLPPDLAAVKDLAPVARAAAYELCASGPLADIKDPATTVLLREKQATPGGHRALAFVDGHCALVAVPKP